MRIIQDGNEEKKCFMKVTCECDAVLEVVPGDFKVVLDQNLGYMSLSEYYYTCPYCNRTNSIPYNQLSEDMRIELEKRSNIW